MKTILNASKLTGTAELLAFARWVANKSAALQGWKADPGGYDVTISDLSDFETKARAVIALAESFGQSAEMSPRFGYATVSKNGDEPFIVADFFGK